MKKKTKQLTALLAVLVLCIAGYLAVVLVNNHQEKKAAAEEAAAAVTVVGLPDPAEITFSNGTDTLSFYQEDAIWYYGDDSDFPLQQSYLTNIAGVLTDLTAVRELKISETLDAYGLEEPVYTVTATDASGEEAKLLIGNQIGDNYYAMRSGGEVLYTIDGTLVGYLGYDLYEMAELEVFDTLDETTVESISITWGSTVLRLEKETLVTEEEVETTDDDGNTVTTTQPSAEYKWYVVTDGEKTRLNAAAVVGDEDASSLFDALLEALSSLSFDACRDYKASNEALASYGLDAPALIFQVSYTAGDEASSAEEYRLRIGSEMEDGDYYYAKLDDSDLICGLSAELVAPMMAAAEALGTDGV